MPETTQTRIPSPKPKNNSIPKLTEFFESEDEIKLVNAARLQKFQKVVEDKEEDNDS